MTISEASGILSFNIIYSILYILISYCYIGDALSYSVFGLSGTIYIYNIFINILHIEKRM